MDQQLNDLMRKAFKKYGEQEIFNAMMSCIDKETVFDYMEKYISVDLDQYLIDELISRTNYPDEIITLLLNKSKGHHNEKYINTAIQNYMQDKAEFVGAVVDSQEKKDRLKEFICTYILPYYNEQQTNLFA